MHNIEHITLQGPEVKPASGGKAKSLVVFMHGVGADGNDLIGLASFLSSRLPDTHFISPNAPQQCDMSPSGYQWFSLRDWSPKSMLEGAKESAPVVNMFLDMQLKRLGLTDDKLALVGFSQGTMMSLFISLRRPHTLAGVAGFSGALIGEEGIVSKPPICLVHGNADQVVPFAAMGLAEAVLKKHEVEVQTHARRNLGHGIDPEGLDIVAKFLEERLK